MIRKQKLYTILLLMILPLCVLGQDDLEALLDEMESAEPEINYSTAAFKSSHVINTQSSELKAPETLEFRIAHRFGALNTGAYELFGLDQASMRLSFDYGFHERLTAGFGRSTYDKAYDFNAKVKIIRQQTGLRSIPVTVLYYTNMAVATVKWADPERQNFFSSRLSYTHQLIVARKFSPGVSLILAPTVIHYNLVKNETDPNTTYATAFSGRVKMSHRTALTFEYIFRVPPGKATDLYSSYYDSFSVGVDIDTGGHIFQLHLSNSLPMYESAFITKTNKSWLDGGIHFGFNITRDFSLKKKVKHSDS